MKPAILGGVPSVDVPFPPPWPQYTTVDRAGVDAMLASGTSFDIYGNPLVLEFERQLAQYHGVTHSLLVNSGTSALHSSFFGVDLGPGDEVLCPSLTFMTTVTPLLHLGVVPIFCDSDPTTGNLSVVDARLKITNRTRGLVVTHLWGHPADMDAIGDLCRAYSLALIEDCSHAHGSEYRGRRVGNFGDAAAISLGTDKVVSGGSAGVLLTSRQDVYERACLLGHHPLRAQKTVVDPINRRFADSGLGFNYRVNPMCALLARSHFDCLDDLLHCRHANLNRLCRGLEGLPGVRPPTTAPHVTRGGWYTFVLRYVPDELGGLSRDRFLAALVAEGVKIRPLLMPLHMMPLFGTDDDALRHCVTGRDFAGARRKLHQSGDLPHAEDIWRNSVSLTTKYFYRPAEELVDRYIAAFHKVVEAAPDLVHDQ